MAPVYGSSCDPEWIARVESPHASLVSWPAEGPARRFRFRSSNQLIDPSRADAPRGSPLMSEFCDILFFPHLCDHYGGPKVQPNFAFGRYCFGKHDRAHVAESDYRKKQICQRRRKNQPCGGAKVYHFGAPGAGDGNGVSTLARAPR